MQSTAQDQVAQRAREFLALSARYLGLAEHVRQCHVPRRASQGR